MDRLLLNERMDSDTRGGASGPSRSLPQRVHMAAGAAAVGGACGCSSQDAEEGAASRSGPDWCRGWCDFRHWRRRWSFFDFDFGADLAPIWRRLRRSQRRRRRWWWQPTQSLPERRRRLLQRQHPYHGCWSGGGGGGANADTNKSLLGDCYGVQAAAPGGDRCSGDRAAAEAEHWLHCHRQRECHRSHRSGIGPPARGGGGVGRCRGGGPPRRP